MTDHPLRVLHVITALKLGGAAKVVVDLLEGGARGGLITGGLCVLGGERAAFAVPGLEFGPVYAGCEEAKQATLAGAPACWRAVRAAVRAFRPQIVHAHLWPAVWPAAAVAGSAGVPVICHVHDTRPWLASRRWQDAVRRAVYRGLLTRSRATCVAVADAVKEYTCANLSFPRERTYVVHNGVDTRFFQPPEHAGPEHPVPVIGTAGRFVPEKGHELLFRAAAELLREGVGFRLRVAGAGSLQERYEKLIDELGLRSVTELPGQVADMRSFYRSIDVFALPSPSAEGLPITLLEAMSMGIPVVATDVGGTSELVENGRSGILVPPRDAGALVEGLRSTLLDRALRDQLGKEARERVVGTFDLSTTCERMEQVYEQVLAQHGTR